MKIYLNIILAILAVAVSACGRDGYQYTGYSSLSPQGWAYGDACEFHVAGGDSIITGNIVLSVTNDNTYPFSNLWLEVSYNALDRTHRDTIEVKLCDVYGNWYGHGLPGHYQLSDTLDTGIVSLRDSSTVRVRHIMRVDTIQGISQLGLSIL